jgi:DNA repair protein RadC
VSNRDVRVAPDSASDGDGDLIARVLGGARPAPELSAAAARLARIPTWQRSSIAANGLARDFGIAADGAARIAALWEFAERCMPDDRPAVCSVRDALLVVDRLRVSRREQVVVLMLDARHRPIRLETVAMGALNASRLHARDVFAPALRHDAVAVIVGHNHPSGDPTPSYADRVVTAALRSAGELLGVPLLDHIIVATRGHHSFRDAERWDDADA